MAKSKNTIESRIDYSILLPVLILLLVGLVSIFIATNFDYPKNLVQVMSQQVLWIFLGSVLAFVVMLFNTEFLWKITPWLYIFGLGLMVLPLVFYSPALVASTGAKNWVSIGSVTLFQPSEFMKIFLIITLSRMIGDFNAERRSNDMMEEFKFLIKVLIVVGIPSVLTFIEPDTGAVLIYFIITIVMLFTAGFKSRWFIATISIILVLGSIFLGIYFLNDDLFIKIFGTSFFYRMDRILNWSNSSGLQLTNSLTAIGSAGSLGHGFNHTPIYFPEMQTDFIFAVFASNFGFIGVLCLISLLIYFDINIISLAEKTNDACDKFTVGGIIAVLLFQQIQNISMTIGLLPIMGITLPFISYGGSSLLSYMTLIGMLFNISNEKLRFKN